MSDAFTPIKTHLKSNILTKTLAKTKPAVRVGEPRFSPHTPLLLINIILLRITTTTQQPTQPHTTQSDSTRDRRGGGCRA